MECPRCGETVDAGAAYCGNCGMALTAVAIGSSGSPAVAAEPVSRTETELPAYAVVSPNQHRAESKSMIALILSVLALPGSIVPLVGWLLAIGAIVMASIVRSKIPRKLMSDLAIGFGSLAVLLSAGVFVYSLQQQNKPSGQSAVNRSALTTSADSLTTISTPCYSVDVLGLDNVENISDSCKARAFNADTILASTNAFNIEGVVQADITATNLAEAGQEIANSYLRTAMPDLTITSQASGQFAGSPAYIINGRSKGNVAIELALVFHKVQHGENIFVLAHAINDAQADLSQFEAGWKWK